MKVSYIEKMIIGFMVFFVIFFAAVVVFDKMYNQLYQGYEDECIAWTYNTGFMYNLTCQNVNCYQASDGEICFVSYDEPYVKTVFSKDKACGYGGIINYTIYEVQVKDRCIKSRLVKYHD